MNAVMREVSAVQDRGPATVVSLDGVTVEYASNGGQGRVRALDNISLEVKRGEFVAVLGPSGCGKSTLLRVLGGLMPPSRGTVKVGGKEVVGPRPDVGIVFQDPTLLPWKTIRQNVMLPATVAKLKGREIEARADNLLQMVGLQDFAKRFPFELSGGMRQRAGIARGLLNDPNVLLMDEPFGALDAMTRERMNEEIARIWAESGTSILFITHSIPEAVLLSDRIVVLSSRPGKVVEVIENKLPRPRSLSIMATKEFGEYAAHLRSLFQVSGAID
ncbi:ABC transporter ATP-binding protein [Burkholderia sp. 22PA0099]|uniref:ABC transporter ATP-binding protein n=1 Tax=Burkholderia sp. 22PA0099 TaxID=3237372 RepID=UPI0039C055B8